MKRFTSRLAAVLAVAAGTAFTLTGGITAASGASTLPTLNLALTGTKGISVSGSEVSGAVNVVSTFSGNPGPNGPSFGIVRLDPGVTIQQAAGAVQSHGGDLNALTPYGALFVSNSAPGTVQTVLTPGNYVALNTSGNGQPAVAPFTVTKSSSPAALPAAQATETSVEFGFHGPTVLHNGTIVRAENGGFLVHMIDLLGVRNKATGQTLMELLRARKDKAAMKLLGNGGSFVNLLDPASPGALQQQVLHTKPGYYVEACFMDTQDHREHTQLGMERLVRVVK